MRFIFSQLDKKTKYTTRCSVKSSTIYAVKRILNMQFLVSKKAKLYAINFRRRKKIVFFLHELKVHFFSPFCNLIHFITKKVKYTTRCSVKSSTIYKENLVFIVYFLFSKNSKTLHDELLQLQKLIVQSFAFF